MKRKIYTSIFLLSTYFSFSQTPEDALKLSWFQLRGTARNQAIGGAMASLGGDASANHINPAGLAFFKTSDFILTPGVRFGKEKSSFRGTNSAAGNDSKFNLGTSGFVFGGFGYRAKNSFAITVTRQADFNYKTFYTGLNDYSSFGEPLADEFASSNLTIDQALMYNSDISIPTRMALYTYLVDTVNVNGNLQVVARSENPSARNQEKLVESTGGITEVNLGWGSELNKKWMAGLSLGINFIKQERRTYYHESDATGNTNNDFSFLTYDERFSLKGYGFNLRGGLIFRPQEYIRIGLALHSPTWMPLKETTNSGFAADLENLFGPGNGYDSVEMSVVTGTSEPIENRYVLNSPAKIMISGAYVFREVEDIRRQKGFITADIEYTNYRWLSYGPYEGENNSATKAPYAPFNEAIDAIYKGTFNFRIGGELKFKVIMARAGFAYYTSPYKDTELKGRKMFASGGLGYRNKGVFVDLTYVHRLNKEVNFPYRVNSPRANTFADLKDNGGNVILTIGFKI
jgi:long-subunit fatty acid transport protein